MNGLLMKDFKLMKGQKNFFFIMIAIAIIMAAFSDDSSFMLGFLPFVISLFTLSTISYDEFDNGNAFLFTLPVSRTGYTVEKYCLALLLGGSSWIFATLLVLIFSILKETAAVSDIIMIAATILPAILVIQAIMIPFQLKFGGERGRIAVIGAVGLLFMIGIVVGKAAEMVGIDISNMINNLPVVSMGMSAVIITAIIVIILLVSMKISISIMKNKEF
ncbi:ABC-2 transporter permease [Lachnospiraceae bacterium 62-35]